jgi:selenide,water dikinase
MGGRVVLALNISAFPEHMPVEAVAAILQAAAAVVREAGGAIGGGHTIRSEEPIFGLAVQGLVHPDQIFTKGGARPGDVLVLSKPIGTGIVLAGSGDDEKAGAIARMKVLNLAAKVALESVRDHVHAVTDVTGFGLAGHGWEIAERSDVVLAFDTARVPLYDGALVAAGAGVRTGGDVRNRAYLEGHVSSTAPPALEALAYDPQTSGGLLASVDAGVADRLEGFDIVGEVQSGGPGVQLS